MPIFHDYSCSFKALFTSINVFYSSPVKYYMVNPIELARNALKNYVRDKNVNFSLGDVRRLTYLRMISLSRVTAVGYINETCKIQDIFKRSDRFIEDIEEKSVDEKEEMID